TKVTRAPARKLLVFLFSAFAPIHRQVTHYVRKAKVNSVSHAERANHLSLLAQRNLAQRNTPRLRARRYRAGSAKPTGFSEGASCPCGIRRTSLCGAPSGPDPPAPPLRRGPECQKPSQNQRQRQRQRHFTATSPSRHRPAAPGSDRAPLTTTRGNTMRLGYKIL